MNLAVEGQNYNYDSSNYYAENARKFLLKGRYILNEKALTVLIGNDIPYRLTLCGYIKPITIAKENTSNYLVVLLKNSSDNFFRSKINAAFFEQDYNFNYLSSLADGGWTCIHLNNPNVAYIHNYLKIRKFELENNIRDIRINLFKATFKT